MNEVDWLGGLDPEAMLAYLTGKVSDRKLRLFACACVRRYWADLSYHSGHIRPDTPARYLAREAVEIAERFAEGEATPAQLEEARQQAEMSAMNAPGFQQLAYQAAHAATLELAMEAATQARELIRVHVVNMAALDLPPMANEQRYTASESAAECRSQGELLHEIFGNPFRAVKVDPNWLSCSSGAGSAILQTIWEDQRYEELPYLADALMDAGCEADALLRHLREPGHVRGCWVVDLLRGVDA